LNFGLMLSSSMICCFRVSFRFICGDEFMNGRQVEKGCFKLTAWFNPREMADLRYKRE
jgi:hypothetical protein